MNSTVDLLGPARARLTVDVPFDELDPGLRGAIGDGGVAGFRAGKLPVHPIDGAAALPAEVEAALLALVSAAEREHGLRPLGRTEIRIVQCGQNRAMRLTADVDVRPHIDVPDLASVVVELDSVDVDEAEVDGTLEELRDRLTTRTDVDRAARTGDAVTVELRAVVADTELGAAASVSYELGSGNLALDLEPASIDLAVLARRLDECLTGLVVGDGAAAAARLLAGPNAGAEAILVLTVVAVQEIHRLPLDDAFAARWGDFASVPELRVAVRGGLVAKKVTQRILRLRDAALARIALAVAEPRGVVRDEVEQRRQRMRAEFERLGTSLPGYLATTGRTEAQLDVELRQVATSKVRSQLVLDAVADAEGLAVTDEEVGRAMTRRATGAGAPDGFYYDRHARAGVRETVVADLRRAKALAFVLRRVSIVDTDGRPVMLPAPETLPVDAIT